MSLALRTKIAFAVTALALAGCASEPAEPVAESPSLTPTPTVTPTPTPTDPGPVAPTDETMDIARGLDAPWSVVRLTSGSALISERDAALVKELQADGEVREIGSVGDTAAGGEGGLLGLALPPGDEASLYAYLTTATDNRIVRMPLLGAAGAYELGEPEVVLDGLERAGNHNGGRIAFGPDGMLYATVGDAGSPDRAQDLDSLNGKILRMTPDGTVPSDNPFDSLVYSYGHRNPQGIAWDSSGQLYAAEFGQDTWDEFNRIEAGANYGWPIVEGESDDDDFVNPLAQWPTDDSSPSGLTAVGDTFFLAGLGGERLWVIDTTGASEDYFVGEFGRIRDVIPGPDGTIWLLTNNTDGRGSPSADDDRIIEVVLAG